MTGAARRAIGITYGAILIAIFVAFLGSGAAHIAGFLVLLNLAVMLTMSRVGRRDPHGDGEGPAAPPFPPEEAP